MSETRAQTQDANREVAAPTTDLKLEVVVIPVSDVDRAKSFYRNLGWRIDADFPFENGFRVVQLTPPGSPTSVQFGTNLTTAAPGSAHGHYLVVSDIVAAHDELADRGANLSAVFHPGTPGFSSNPTARTTGPRDVLPTARATAPSSPSRIRTATAGSCRRSPSDCQVASVPRSHRSRRPVTSPRHCSGLRPPMASTRSETVASTTSSGRTGTPPTWWPSTTATRFRPEETAALPAP